jgi:hypothetical protein
MEWLFEREKVIISFIIQNVKQKLPMSRIVYAREVVGTEGTVVVSWFAWWTGPTDDLGPVSSREDAEDDDDCGVTR